MSPPVRCAPRVRLLGTCHKGGYNPSPFHNDHGPIYRWIFLLTFPPLRGTLRSCRLIPLPGVPTALQTAEALFTNVFRHYGVPEDIVSDRGPQFTSRVWRAFMGRLGVSVSLTSGYHPESNGQVERVNQQVGRFLRSYCQDRPGEWARYIPWAEMAQN
jgi:hypothetical protein